MLALWGEYFTELELSQNGQKWQNDWSVLIFFYEIGILRDVASLIKTLLQKILNNEKVFIT